MKIGDKIRRKNHKNKTRKNNHPIFTIISFSKSKWDDLEFVQIQDDRRGAIYSMNKKGLQHYEIVGR